jgi:hypothetical protein
VNHGPGIGGDSAARLIERPPAAAAKVDTKLLEHRGCSKIIHYQITNRSCCDILIHDCGSIPTQSSDAADGTV